LVDSSQPENVDPDTSPSPIDQEAVMNALDRQGIDKDDDFVDLVDFKWLMAGIGWWVDLSRLQRDTTYAGVCIERGISSGSSLLRQRSTGLRSRFAAVPG
jgi:hypothetical protein